MADSICEVLEKNGIYCWIAPRDIRAKFKISHGIKSGINNCNLVVLGFSRHTQNSSSVKDEMEHAFHEGKTILPYRLSPVEMDHVLEIYPSSNNWIDADSDDREYSNLITAVKRCWERK